MQPAPQLLVLPGDVASLDEAHAAIDLWEFYSRKRLDSTQRQVVEVMMACQADGRWAAMTTGREMARQNGKGDEIEVPEFWGLVKLSEAILHTVHDAVLLASQAQERMLGLFDHRDLRHLTDGGTVWKGTGQQMIRLSTGGQIWYRTRTGGGGRGVDQIDRLVVDEAQHATAEQLASVTSTLMAAADPQLNAMGTAALPGKSTWWWKQRRRALSKDPGRFGYVGHTAETVWMDDAGVVHQQVPDDLHDQRLWLDVNPAVAAGRGQGLAFLEEEWHRLGPEGFGQEHLCIWAPEEGSRDQGPIDLTRWGQLTDGQSMATDETLTLGMDAPLDRRSVCFSITGFREDGLRHGAIRHWVPPTDLSRVVEIGKQLADGHRAPIHVPPGSKALAWREDLERAGVTVIEVKSAAFTEAQQVVEQAVADGTFRHRGQPEMITAVAGLAARMSGDASPWSRRSSSANVAPLFALAAAVAGAAGKTSARSAYEDHEPMFV